MKFEYGSKNNRQVFEFDHWSFIRQCLGLGILFIWICGFVALMGNAIYENFQPAEYNHITVLDKKADSHGRIWLKTRNSDGSISKYLESPSQGEDPFVNNVTFEVGKTYRVADPTNRAPCDFFVGMTLLFLILSAIAVVPVSLIIADLWD